jgi:hypothetical protein
MGHRFLFSAINFRSLAIIQHVLSRRGDLKAANICTRI